MEPHEPPKEKKKLSNRAIAIVMAITLICVSLLGVFIAHQSAVSNYLSPSSLMLNQSEVDIILPESLGFMMPQVPTANNFAAVDFTPLNPLPVFGGNVTSPNLVIYIIKNSSEESAVSGFNYLKSAVNSVLPEKISSNNLFTFTLASFNYRNVTFFNGTMGTGAVLAVVDNYIVLVGVYDSSLSVLKAASQLQANRINKAVTYEQDHYLL